MPKGIRKSSMKTDMEATCAEVMETMEMAQIIVEQHAKIVEGMRALRAAYIATKAENIQLRKGKAKDDGAKGDNGTGKGKKKRLTRPQIEELKRLVEEYVEQHASAGWAEIWKGVPNIYSSSTTLRVQMRRMGFTLGASPETETETPDDGAEPKAPPLPVDRN